jgi:Leucine-rich repeat (LRR) protein
LDGNHVSRIQDNVFDNSSDLEEIHLSHNRLIAIPKVSNIPALQVLDVSYNRIETVNTDKLADSIRVVDLSHNIIHDVEFLANPFHSKKYPIKINLSFNLIRSRER